MENSICFLHLLFESFPKGWVDHFLKEINVTRPEYRGGRTLHGNQAKKLLSEKSIAELRKLARVTLSPLNAIRVFAASRTLDKFRDVVNSVFGYTIEGDYVSAIKSFSESYRSLPDISITPKVHIVESHIVQFMDRKKEQGYTTHGLGFWSEQAFESCHHDLSEAWNLRKFGKDHQEYEQKFFNCFLDYNSGHV